MLEVGPRSLEAGGATLTGVGIGGAGPGSDRTEAGASVWGGSGAGSSGAEIVVAATGCPVDGRSAGLIDPLPWEARPRAGPP